MGREEYRARTAYLRRVQPASTRSIEPLEGRKRNRPQAVADTIWEAAGDTATDYNRQTKRALLSAVIPSIVLRWLDTYDREALARYIDRKLQRAMKVGQTGGKILRPALDFAEQVRARRKPRNL